MKYYDEYTQEFIEPICTLPYGGSFSDISYAINDHINQYRWKREQYNESNEYLINNII